MIRPKFRARDTLFLFAVLAATTVYYFFVSQPAVSFGFSAQTQTLTLSGPEDTSCTLSLSQIEGITLAEVSDYGAAVTGGETWQGNLYGLWSCDALGEYEAYVSTRIPVCIVLESDGRTVAFNLENAETTRSLAQQLIDYWQQNS